MNPVLIRKVWKAVDNSAVPNLLQLSDDELAHQLTEQIDRSAPLKPEDLSELEKYVLQKAGLIRDIVCS